jgi:hypothetical protein
VTAVMPERAPTLCQRMRHPTSRCDCAAFEAASRVGVVQP